MAGVTRVVLVGFSGTGKSTIARLLADRLGWSAADTDDEIVRSAGVSIPTIFREYGEATFRAKERGALESLLDRENIVIATGGGAAIDASAWDEHHLGRSGCLVLGLEANPETILTRLRAQTGVEGESVERPLLASAEPLSRIRALKGERQHMYDKASLSLTVDNVEPTLVADELALVTRSMSGQALPIRLDAASARSDISVGSDSLATIGKMIRSRWPRAHRAWIITDANVGPLHGEPAAQSLRSAGFLMQSRSVEAGERSKSLATASELYDWLLGNGIERDDVVIALGGGVVGDLVGFVAATVLRGVGFVQVPTTLLAAVDSSVGGKTGINHASGKNLIGSFLQPGLVIIDPELLRTVPLRELRSGWGEVVKHAVIQRSTPGGERGDLASLLLRNAAQLMRLEAPALSYVIWRNVALKAAVVAADERETGIREQLNFGHTLGHAIEATDYALLHGEAISVGMRAASRIGVDVGTCDEEDAGRIDHLIDSFGLPAHANIDEASALQRLKSDKKRVAGRQRYVLPLRGGGVTLRDDVPEDVVSRALSSVNSKRAANEARD